MVQVYVNLDLRSNIDISSRGFRLVKTSKPTVEVSILVRSNHILRTHRTAVTQFQKANIKLVGCDLRLGLGDYLSVVLKRWCSSHHPSPTTSPTLTTTCSLVRSLPLLSLQSSARSHLLSITIPIRPHKHHHLHHMNLMWSRHLSVSSQHYVMSVVSPYMFCPCCRK